MAKFEVFLEVPAMAVVEVEIDADNVGQASIKALNNARNHGYDEHWAWADGDRVKLEQTSVTGVREVKTDNSNKDESVDVSRTEAFMDELFDTELHVRCGGFTCDKSFPIESGEYYTVYGNVTLGKSGGLVGHNFDEEGKLQRVSIYCLDCLKRILFGLD